MVEIISRPIFVWCFWLIMAVGNLLWTTFPQLLMLVSKARDWEPGENVTTKIPLSSLLHRPFPEERRLHLKEEVYKIMMSSRKDVYDLSVCCIRSERCFTGAMIII